MSDSSDGACVAEALVEVRSYELDSFGHVNHAVFLNYLEYARFEALRQGGFPYEDLVARGWGVYVVRIEVDYLKEARLGDRLLVRTSVAGSRRSSVVFAQEICRAAEPDVVLARARVTAVWVGPDRRPTRVPEAVRVALGMTIAGEAGTA
ncbi:MAG: acyl-CoA thioesterase [Gemmatimonadetes bacterium]|nr:acyl-CoA thioesterase [Gemmatimonadota bacterium]